MFKYKNWYYSFNILIINNCKSNIKKENTKLKNTGKYDLKQYVLKSVLNIKWAISKFYELTFWQKSNYSQLITVVQKLRFYIIEIFF